MFFVPAKVQVLEFFNLPLEDEKLLKEHKENVPNVMSQNNSCIEGNNLTKYNNFKSYNILYIISFLYYILGIASWKDDNTVKMLIYLWKEHEVKFKSSKIRNDTVWKEISAKMWEANSNWHYSATQCENKWKDLRKTC